MKKIALITGGTSGIGKKTAELLYADGYLPVIVGSSEESIHKTKKELEIKKIECDCYACDLREEKNIVELFSIIGKKYDVIDCLIHSAGGLLGRKAIFEMTSEFYKNVMALNFESFVYLSREVFPYLSKSKNSPSIIAFSSIAAYDGGGPGASIYASSKGALTTFVKSAAKEFISKGIRVNAISPGVISTPFHSATNPELLETFKKNIPMGRFGSDEEIAQLVAFLVSPKASYIVGEVIQINGGQRMQ